MPSISFNDQHKLLILRYYPHDGTNSHQLITVHEDDLLELYPEWNVKSEFNIINYVLRGVARMVYNEYDEYCLCFEIGHWVTDDIVAFMYTECEDIVSPKPYPTIDASSDQIRAYLELIFSNFRTFELVQQIFDQFPEEYIDTKAFNHQIYGELLMDGILTIPNVAKYPNYKHCLVREVARVIEINNTATPLQMLVGAYNCIAPRAQVNIHEYWQ